MATNNERALKFLEEYNAEQKQGLYNLVDDGDYLMLLDDEGECLSEEMVGSSRWWDDIYRVIQIGGKLIGYASAATTGDDSAYDKGWEFDKSSIEEVEEYEETITVKKYRPVEEGE